MRADAEFHSRSPEGRYANFFKIGFNAQEFLIDFGQFTPGDESANEERHLIRIVLVPFNMKRFLHLVQESVDSYQKTYSIIPDADMHLPMSGEETRDPHPGQGEP